MLHIAQHNIGRFPPPRLHDGQRIKTGHHHVLGGADAHGVAGKCAKDGRIEASPAGGPLDDPPDGRGRQRPLVRPVEVKRPEQRTRLQLSGLEPAGEEGRGFRREIGKAPIARGVGFRARYQDCRRAADFKAHMLDRHNGELRASAERIVTGADKRCVPGTRKCGGAGGDDLRQNGTRKAQHLLGPARLPARRAA